MALQCPIRRMDVRVSRHHGKQYLAPALRNNYPQHLRCAIPFNDGLGDLDELFPSEGADTLTHLIMWADLNIGWPDVKHTQVPWSQFKDKLIASIRHLRLTHLRLVFQYDILHHDLERDSVPTAGETDLHPAATEFASAIPTLQYIFLATCGDTCKFVPRPGGTSLGCAQLKVNKWLASKAWRVVHNRHDRDEHHPALPNASADTEVSCTELSGSAADRIMDREELDLPRCREDTLRYYDGDYTIRTRW
ncbi:hypothetical protein V8D89_007926 [Ganoderma adspersum]